MALSSYLALVPLRQLHFVDFAVIAVYFPFRSLCASLTVKL